MTLTVYENTFATLAFAEEYFSARPYSEAWSSATSLQKEQALIFATMKINNFNFIGEKKEQNQALEFPRNFLPELPKEIQMAVCEEALAILDKSVHSQNKKLGISSVTMGNSSVSYFDNKNLGVLLSEDALAFVSKWTAKNFDMT